MKDGNEHINVYSRGNTELGQLLSNFARTPFMHPTDGPFTSVEGWWYWRECKDEKLRDLVGLEAKAYGSALRAGIPRKEPPTKAELKAVYHAKIACNPYLKRLLLESTLPFDHYYEYAGKIKQSRWRWTGVLWEEIRAELREQARQI